MGGDAQGQPLPFLPAEWHGKEVLIFAACYSGDMAEVKKATKALRALGKPIADVISPWIPTRVQPRRQHWFLNEKSGFPFPTPAFWSVPDMAEGEKATKALRARG